MKNTFKYGSYALSTMLLIAPSAYAIELSLKPHKAIYTISLQSVDSGSAISDIKGKMVIELRQDCQGWALIQDAANVMELKNAPADLMRSRYVAWESHDGKMFKFSSERVFNERVADKVDGTAGFGANGGLITYINPEKRQVAIEKGTLPGISHMQNLITQAKNGKAHASEIVFDGSFFGNPVQINTFIGNEKKSCANAAKAQSAWPMSLAVYALPSTGSNPNFEITQTLADNGVMCSYTINFGDYIVKGELERVEFIPQKRCAKK